MKTSLANAFAVVPSLTDPRISPLTIKYECPQLSLFLWRGGIPPRSSRDRPERWTPERLGGESLGRETGFASHPSRRRGILGAFEMGAGKSIFFAVWLPGLRQKGTCETYVPMNVRGKSLHGSFTDF